MYFPTSYILVSVLVVPPTGSETWANYSVCLSLSFFSSKIWGDYGKYYTEFVVGIKWVTSEKHLVLALWYSAKEKKIGPEDYSEWKIKEGTKKW